MILLNMLIAIVMDTYNEVKASCGRADAWLFCWEVLPWQRVVLATQRVALHKQREEDVPSRALSRAHYTKATG